MLQAYRPGKSYGQASPAGTNRMELLLFSLGGEEIYGINVFKVREVGKATPVAWTPNAPRGVVGVTSLRGNIIPVVALSQLLGDGEGMAQEMMIVTEYNRRVQALLVHTVERIERVDWAAVQAAEAVHGGGEELISLVTRLADGRLVSILHVEQLLQCMHGERSAAEPVPLQRAQPASILFAEDSAIARKEIIGVLDRLGVRYQQAVTGREAWRKLQGLADQAAQKRVSLQEGLHLVLVDAEMPEMDGYSLIRNIRADMRFQGIPIVMYSSLSSQASRAMGQQAGADAFVAKFEPVALAETLRSLLQAG